MSFGEGLEAKRNRRNRERTDVRSRHIMTTSKPNTGVSGTEVPEPGDSPPYIDNEVPAVGTAAEYMRDDTTPGLVLYGSPGDAAVVGDGDASLEFTDDSGTRRGLRARLVDTYVETLTERIVPLGLNADGLYVRVDLQTPGNVNVSGTNDGLTADADIDDILGAGTKGDLLYYDGANWVSLGIGDDGEVLTVATDVPSWASAAGGASPFAVGHQIMAWRTDDHTVNGYKWVLEDGRTIGNAASGATLAHADYEDLFLWLWALTHYHPATDQVVGGRGATAAIDWANGEKLTLPDWTRDGDGNNNPASPVGAGGGAALDPGERQGIAEHAHSGVEHSHTVDNHEHTVTANIGYTTSSGYTGLELSHTVEPLGVEDGGTNVLYDTDGEGGTSHDIGTHKHSFTDGETSPAEDLGTDTAGGGDTGTSTTYHPVMATGMFVLAWTP